MLATITQAVRHTFFPRIKPSILPTSMDLASHFEKFVDYWEAADFEYLGPLRERLSDLPVEVSVRWKGKVGGRIVIRCRAEFLKWLEESRQNKALNIPNEVEIFHEMSSLYAVYLIYSFWMADFSEMGLIEPNRSTPAYWPAGEPTATCGLLVQNNLVEIRLWAGIASV
jgi:hypothetical protein